MVVDDDPNKPPLPNKRDAMDKSGFALVPETVLVTCGKCDPEVALRTTAEEQEEHDIFF